MKKAIVLFKDKGYDLVKRKELQKCIRKYFGAIYLILIPNNDGTNSFIPLIPQEELTKFAKGTVEYTTTHLTCNSDVNEIYRNELKSVFEISDIFDLAYALYYQNKINTFNYYIRYSGSNENYPDMACLFIIESGHLILYDKNKDIVEDMRFKVPLKINMDYIGDNFKKLTSLTNIVSRKYLDYNIESIDLYSSKLYRIVRFTEVFNRNNTDTFLLALPFSMLYLLIDKREYIELDKLMETTFLHFGFISFVKAKAIAALKSDTNKWYTFKELLSTAYAYDELEYYERIDYDVNNADELYEIMIFASTFLSYISYTLRTCILENSEDDIGSLCVVQATNVNGNIFKDILLDSEKPTYRHIQKVISTALASNKK